MMGVAGSGKSSVAAQLSSELEASFLDADDLHSKRSTSPRCREVSRSTMPIARVARGIRESSTGLLPKEFASYWLAPR